MQPITPTSSALARTGPNAGPIMGLACTPLDLARDIGRTSPSSGAVSNAATGLLLRDIHDALGQLMLGVGGSQESDKLLQMMVALLILLALLEQASVAEGRAGGGPAAQLPRANSPETFILMSATSTTISVEQTSVYMTASPDAGTLGAPVELPSTGSQMDLSA